MRALYSLASLALSIGGDALPQPRLVSEATNPRRTEPMPPRPPAGRYFHDGRPAVATRQTRRAEERRRGWANASPADVDGMSRRDRRRCAAGNVRNLRRYGST